MNAVNAVLLFILVWTFTAVCQADDDISVSCDDVTGSVRKEVTFTCSVSLQLTECCIQKFMFQYPESYKDSTICKQELPKDSCEQSNSFTCSYTPTTAVREQFRFFVQTKCGVNRTEFTVNITGPTTSEIVTGAPGKKAEVKNQNVSGTSAPDTTAGLGSKVSVIAAAVGCFILIIIIMTIIHKKSNFTKPCGFQKRIFLCIKHDDDNSNCPENVV